MASALASDPINQLEENLQCSVCLEVLTNPRTLPCCHSFCKVCLERIVETCRGEAPRGQRIREFPCPNCRTTFILDPDQHVADMPRNHFICNMVKVAAVLDRGTRVPCSHNCSQSYSVARCVTCEKFLCRECLTGHNNYRGNNGHSVLTMKELSKPENRKKINDKMYCNEHSGKKLKVYCETCNRLICRDCMDFKHVKQGHSCVLVKDEANKYKEILALNNKTMTDALIEGNAFLGQLILTTEQLDYDANNAKNTIVQRKQFVAKKVLEMLDKRAESLCKKVDEIHNSKRVSLDKQTEGTKLYVENIRTSVQLSKKLIDQGTEEEIISSQKMMLDNANSLLKNRKKYFKAPIPDAKLRYSSSTVKEPVNEDILRGLVNSLGEVSEEKKDTVYVQLVGNQPPGKMTVSYVPTSVAGYHSCGSVTIIYKFEGGIQGPEHPNPGQRYFGMTQYAYLPDNEEGNKVLKLLRKAFDQKLTFTIVRNDPDMITWNGIEHKTKRTGGSMRRGYPDPFYLKRVQEKLAAKGITE